VNEANRIVNARAEIEASDEALSAAEALLRGGLLRSAVSRLYYGMLHLVRALIVSRGFDPRTHEGVETLFALHFVRPGVVDLRFGKVFAHLQKFREQADYGPMLALTVEEVGRDLATVREFAAEVRRILAMNQRGES
jgi:uncharacterized protein (UPF0332 family)